MTEPKYKQVFENLKTDILSGKYRRGSKLPSEAALVQRTGLSRITISRAFRELQNAALVQRVAGSGSFAYGAALEEQHSYLFGLLIPELGQTEIFAPICRAISNSPAARSHALLWGNPGRGSIAKQAYVLLDQFVERNVDGVFFAPLETSPESEQTNRRILRRLKREKIAFVLLDRRVANLTSRDRTDIVGINHRHAAFVATEHLITQGCKRLAFITGNRRSSSVHDRIVGFQEATKHYGVPASEIESFDLPSDEKRIHEWFTVAGHVGAVCVNDQVAGSLQHLILRWELRIPHDVAVTGIDDLVYAAMLPVALTTVRQPIDQIGDGALQLMLERMASPQRPARELWLDGELVVRDSSLRKHDSSGHAIPSKGTRHE